MKTKRMPIIAKLACAVLLLTVGMAQADMLAPQVPQTFTSPNGKHVFKMQPGKGHMKGKTYVRDQEAFGVAYSITENGSPKEMWRTQGWYSFQGYLSENGRYFVRIVPWPLDSIHYSDVAIVFFDRGKKIKEYRVNELIGDTKAIIHTSVLYHWQPVIQTRPNGFTGDIFHLVMIDKTAYRFDGKTGNILSRRQDKGAKRNSEISSKRKP